MKLTKKLLSLTLLLLAIALPITIGKSSSVVFAKTLTSPTPVLTGLITPTKAHSRNNVKPTSTPKPRKNLK